MDDRAASSALLSPPELSSLEQEVLDEYERLADNMKNVSPAEPLFPLKLTSYFLTSAFLFSAACIDSGQHGRPTHY
jgi:hypothetical protein